MSEETTEFKSSKKGTDFVLLADHTQAGVQMKKGDTITLYSKKKIDWFRKQGAIA